MLDAIFGILFIVVMGFFLWIELIYFAGDKHDDNKRENDNL